MIDLAKLRVYGFSPAYSKEVMEIFNHYVENSFAAYPESALPEEFFSGLSEMVNGYPAFVIEYGQEIAGFCFLRPWHAFSTFRETAEITYFIRKEFTGSGIGRIALEKLESEGRKKGIRMLLASISSENPGSIQFHRRNGFTECGCFREVGKKFGKFFDVVWMQKKIG